MRRARWLAHKDCGWKDLPDFMPAIWRERLKVLLEAARESGTLLVVFSWSKDEEEDDKRVKRAAAMAKYDLEKEQRRREELSASIKAGKPCPQCKGQGGQGSKCPTCDGAGYI